MWQFADPTCLSRHVLAQFNGACVCGKSIDTLGKSRYLSQYNLQPHQNTTAGRSQTNGCKYMRTDFEYMKCSLPKLFRADKEPPAPTIDDAALPLALPHLPLALSPLTPYIALDPLTPVLFDPSPHLAIKSPTKASPFRAHINLHADHQPPRTTTPPQTPWASSHKYTRNSLVPREYQPQSSPESDHDNRVLVKTQPRRDPHHKLQCPRRRLADPHCVDFDASPIGGEGCQLAGSEGE